jgi:hypothetical protein
VKRLAREVVRRGVAANLQLEYQAFWGIPRIACRRLSKPLWFPGVGAADAFEEKSGFPVHKAEIRIFFAGQAIRHL